MADPLSSSIDTPGQGCTAIILGIMFGLHGVPEG